MSRGFTERTGQRVHDIKRRNGIRRQEKPAYWVCQDLVNMENCLVGTAMEMVRPTEQSHDVAGSEADIPQHLIWVAVFKLYLRFRCPICLIIKLS